MSGDMLGYAIEFNNAKQKEWKEISLRRAMPEHGIPPAGAAKGVTHDLGLLTWEQAQALAWTFLAHQLAFEDQGYTTEVRIVPYRIKYSVKAWRKEDKAIALDRR